jgi:hypothetical protein
MKPNRIGCICGCVSVAILLFSIPAIANPTRSENICAFGIPKSEDRLKTSSVDERISTLNDVPGLLARAGIPLEDLWLSKPTRSSLTPSGEADYLWHTFYGSWIDDNPEGIAVDGNGGVYIAGFSYDTWDGPAGQAPLHAHSVSGGWDLAVLKLDAAGDYQWHTFYGSTDWDEGGGIALDVYGGVYLSGYSYGSWTGPEDQVPLHSYSGGWDFTVLKLGTAGTYQWHTFYGSENDDFYTRIAVDGIGGVYIAGSSWGSWNGPAGQQPLHAYCCNDDIAVLKLDSEGAYQWHTFYGASFDNSRGIAVDNIEGVYITGLSYGSFDGSEGQAPLNAYTGGYDIFVLKLDLAGAYRWHTFYGAASDDIGYGVAVDGNGGVYITGNSSAAWSGPTGEAPLHSYSGDLEIPVIKLNQAGAYQWHTFYGGERGEAAMGITTDSRGGVYVTGRSTSAWTGPGGELPLNAFLGDDDITVFKLDDQGTYSWHTFYGGTETGHAEGREIEVAANDGIYVLGYSVDTWKGPAGQPPLHAYTDSYDFAVLKLQVPLIPGTIANIYMPFMQKWWDE